MTIADHSIATVRPRLDYTFSIDGDTMTYLAKTSSRSRTTLAAFLAMPFTFVAGLAAAFLLPFVLIMGGSNGASMIGPVILTILVSGGIAFAIYALGSVPKTVPISANKDAIIFRHKRYLREHFEFLGWRSSGGYVSYGGAAHNTGAALGYALSGSIYMRYGSKEITLITGLHPDRVEAVYTDLARAMNKVGWSFDV